MPVSQKISPSSSTDNINQQTLIPSASTGNVTNPTGSSASSLIQHKIVTKDPNSISAQDVKTAKENVKKAKQFLAQCEQAVKQNVILEQELNQKAVNNSYAIQAHESDINQLSQAINEAELKLQEIKKQIAQKDINHIQKVLLPNLECEIENYNFELEKIKKDIDKTNKENNKKKAELSSCQKKIQELKDRGKKEGESKKLRQAHKDEAALVKDSKKIVDKLNALEAKKQQLTHSVHSMLQRQKGMNENIDQINKDITGLSQEYDLLLTQRTHLEHQVAEKKRKILNFHNQASDIEEEIKDTLAKFEDLKLDLISAEKQYHEACVKYDRISTIFSSKKASMLKQEFIVSKQPILVQRQPEQDKYIVNASKVSRHALLSQFSKVSSTLSNVEKNYSDASASQKKLEELTLDISRTKKSLDEAQNRLDSINAKKASLLKRSDEVFDKIEQKNAEVKKLSKDLSKSIEDSKGILVHRISGFNLKKEVAELSAEQIDIGEKINKCEDQATECSAEIESLNKIITHYESTLYLYNQKRHKQHQQLQDTLSMLDTETKTLEALNVVAGAKLNETVQLPPINELVIKFADCNQIDQMSHNAVMAGITKEYVDAVAPGDAFKAKYIQESFYPEKKQGKIFDAKTVVLSEYSTLNYKLTFRDIWKKRVDDKNIFTRLIRVWREYCECRRIRRMHKNWDKISQSMAKRQCNMLETLLKVGYLNKGKIGLTNNDMHKLNKDLKLLDQKSAECVNLPLLVRNLIAEKTAKAVLQRLYKKQRNNNICINNSIHHICLKLINDGLLEDNTAEILMHKIVELTAVHETKKMMNKEVCSSSGIILTDKCKLQDVVQSSMALYNPVVFCKEFVEALPNTDFNFTINNKTVPIYNAIRSCPNQSDQYSTTIARVNILIKCQELISLELAKHIKNPDIDLEDASAKIVNALTYIMNPTLFNKHRHANQITHSTNGPVHNMVDFFMDQKPNMFSYIYDIHLNNDGTLTLYATKRASLDQLCYNDIGTQTDEDDANKLNYILLNPKASNFKMKQSYNINLISLANGESLGNNIVCEHASLKYKLQLHDTYDFHKNSDLMTTPVNRNHSDSIVSGKYDDVNQDGSEKKFILEE